MAAGTTETVFSAAFANQDAAGYSVVMTVVHGAIVASQSWAVDFTAYQLQTETLTWAAPANAAAGAYTVIVQIKNPAGAVQSTSLASFTVTGAVAVNGACGAANGTAVSVAPVAGLCAAGTATAVSGTGPWNWVCDGSGGGTNSGTCTAPLQTAAVNGACGAANGTPVATAPVIGLCATGTATSVAGTGPWTGCATGREAGRTRERARRRC